MIDKDKLEELLADENATFESIYGDLGFNNEAAFYYHLKKDSDAKKLFADWRATHKRTPAGAGSSARVGKGAKTTTPPATGMPSRASATSSYGKSSTSSNTSRSISRSVNSLTS